MVLANKMQAKVDGGGAARRGKDPAILGVQHIRVDPDLAMALLQLRGEHPVLFQRLAAVLCGPDMIV